MNRTHIELLKEEYPIEEKELHDFYYERYTNLKCILIELEEWAKSEYDRYLNDEENLVLSNVELIDFSRFLDKIQKLKEEYK